MAIGRAGSAGSGGVCVAKRLKQLYWAAASSAIWPDAFFLRKRFAVDGFRCGTQKRECKRGILGLQFQGQT